jgi:VWFA-related protein
MRPAVSAVLGWLAVVLSAWSGQEPPRQVPPTFRTGIDIVQLDVSVLDRSRRPVRGLTAADFTVLADGEPRPIVAFRSIDLAPPRQMVPTGSIVIAPDVATNALPDGRLIVILLDQSTRTGYPAVLAKRTASAVVEAMAPGDLAAVLHTNRGIPQNFTSDPERLLEAINSSALGTVLPGARDDFERGECQCGVCSLEAITSIARALQREPQRRKTVLFVGERIALYPSQNDACNVYLKPKTDEMLRAVHLGNVSVHAIDPSGLETTAPGAEVRVPGRFAAAVERANRAVLLHRQNTLRELAHQTGGRAVLNTNAPAVSIRDILDESSSYYLLAFQTPIRPTDSGFHPITVKVNRRGVEVRTRRGYYGPSQSPTPATAAALSLEDLRGLLPQSGLPLTMAAAAFAIPGRSETAILIAAGVRREASNDRAEARAAGDSAIESSRIGQVEVLAGVFPVEGTGAEWHRQRFDLPPGTGQSGGFRFEALSRLDVKPGRYELRVGVRHAASAHTGTVHAYVDVPDFADEPVSLSGVVISEPGAVTATPRDAVGGIIPDIPTASREFFQDDEPSALVRVYQRQRDAAAVVTVLLQITGADSRRMVERMVTLQPSDFEIDHRADIRLELPVDRFAPGEYLLTVEAGRAGATARRHVRFRVNSR